MLVIDMQASSGVMIAATILLSRALQPVGHLIGGWRLLSFDWLMAHATESDGNTVLDLGDHQLTLNGVSSSQLHEHDFILG